METADTGKQSTPERAEDIDADSVELVMEAAGFDLWENDLASGAVTRKARKIFAELGYGEAETASYMDDLFILIHPDDLSRVKAALGAHLAGDTPDYRCEFRVRSKAGAWVWYANQGKIMGRPGQSGQRLIGVTFNIDARRREQALLAEQQQLLRESEGRQRDLLRNLHTGIVVYGADSRIIYSNPRALALLGLSEAQLNGRLAIDPAWGLIDEQGATLDPQDYPVSIVMTTLQPLEAQVVGARRSGSSRVMWLLVNAFPECDADGALKRIIVNFDDISPRKQAEEKIHHLAFFDALTGLANRRLLLDRINTALAGSARSGLHGALLFIDLDKFKTINDALGHGVGDQMLIEVARRLAACVRDTDTVARLGGDEFVMLVPGLDADAALAAHKAAQVAEKVRHTLNAPYRFNDNTQHGSPSIGVSLYLGAVHSADTLLRQADMAMYKAKDAGRNTVRFFNPAMQLAVESHAALAADLRQAVTRGELHLLYQIQVDAHGKALGAEALARWVHPLRGTVSPLQFIPIAEESALILVIGGWVLETACAQLAAWQRDPHLRHLSLAVNVSAQQFRQSDFVAKLATLLARYQFNIAQLKLELTESVVLNDVADVVAKMHALRALGATLSMDDFGTGYSSLSYLKQLPLHQIKIDQSFVRNIATDATDAVMVRTIIDLARNFGLHVIAEGVETEAQLAFLREHGCNAYQGYLFGRPMPIEALETMLKKSGNA